MITEAFNKVKSYFLVFQSNILLKDLNNTLIAIIKNYDEEIASKDKEILELKEKIKSNKLKIDSQRNTINYYKKKLPN